MINTHSLSMTNQMGLKIERTQFKNIVLKFHCKEFIQRPQKV